MIDRTVFTHSQTLAGRSSGGTVNRDHSVDTGHVWIQDCGALCNCVHVLTVQSTLASGTPACDSSAELNWLISASKAIGERADTVSCWQAACGFVGVAASREGRQSEAVAGRVAVVVVGAGARAVEHGCRRVALSPGGRLCSDFVDC